MEALCCKEVVVSQPRLKQMACSISVVGLREVLWCQPLPFFPLSHTQTMWRHPIHTCLSLLTLHHEEKERGKQQTPAMQTNWSQRDIWKAVFTTKSPTWPLTMLSPRRQRAPRKRKTKVWTPSLATFSFLYFEPQKPIGKITYTLPEKFLKNR